MVFCNIGYWVVIEWFVLFELVGLLDVKFYLDLMVGWL